MNMFRPKFRLSDLKTGDIISTYPNAIRARIGYENRNREIYPDVGVQIWGTINSCEGLVGSYWHIGRDGLVKEYRKEVAIHGTF
jgi:hypothetical protein